MSLFGNVESEVFGMGKTPLDEGVYTFIFLTEGSDRPVIDFLLGIILGRHELILC